MEVQATARKVIKDLQEQLKAETSAHQQIIETLNKCLETDAQAEIKIQELSEVAKK